MACAPELGFISLGISDALSEVCVANQWRSPREVQQRCIPLLLRGESIMCRSPTGSGKTGCYILPILHLIGSNMSHNKLHTLVLVPTNILVRQVFAMFKMFKDANPDIKFGRISGEFDETSKLCQYSKKPHIIIATCRALVEFTEKYHAWAYFQNLQYLIVDEADRFSSQVPQGIWRSVCDMLPKEKVTAVFTATGNMTPLVQLLTITGRSFANIMMCEPFSTVSSLAQFSTIAEPSETFATVGKILRDHVTHRVVVYCCKADIEQLQQYLRTQNHHTFNINRDTAWGLRDNRLRNFESAHPAVLIATEFLSWGFDFKAVDLIINVAVPSTAADYIHRVGRTARGLKSGTAVTIVSSSQVRKLRAIQSAIGVELLPYIFAAR